MDRILAGARLLSFHPKLRGDSILVRAGRVEAVAALEELRSRAPCAEIVDLRGCLLVSGLTDTHTHFFEWARRLSGIDLSAARSVEEFTAYLRDARRCLPERPRWVGGSGWDPRRYGRPELIDRRIVDEIFPDRPVVLEARDFHTLLCNSSALQAMGLLGPGSEEVSIPKGGKIGRFEDGSPDGLLHETAWELVWKSRPLESDDVADQWLDQAVRRAHALGLTGVHCMEPESTLSHYRRRARQGMLGLRVCFHSPLDHLEERIERGEPSYRSADPWLRPGGVKIFMDGSLGSRSACMHDPYPDGSHGWLLREPDELRELLRRSAEAGISGTVHAIGDRTVDEVVAVLEQCRRWPGGSLLRPRLEHAQCVRPSTQRRIRSAHIYCAMQAVHLADDIPLLDREWGEAARWAYPLGSLLREGVVVGLGSDVPVADPDPRLGIHAAMARRAAHDPTAKPWRPEERIGAIEALRGYTAHAAIGGGREDDVGSLRPGELADLTAFDDVLDEPAEAWLEARVRLTMVDGKIVYRDR